MGEETEISDVVKNEKPEPSYRLFEERKDREYKPRQDVRAMSRQMMHNIRNRPGYNF